MLHARPLAVVALLMFSALAYGGVEAESPKPYCEQAPDLREHHYGPPSDGQNLGPPVDGSILRCEWGVDEPCVDRFSVQDTAWLRAGLAGRDGHCEYATGGAWILACQSICGLGDGGGGTRLCFGEDAHHPWFGPFYVTDAVLGSGAGFDVAADTISLVGPDPTTGIDCGDFMTETAATCTGYCTVTFPPGRDGAYRVYVTGFAGVISA